MQVTRDPLPVRDHRQLLAVDDGLGAVEREPGLVGEGGEQLLVLHSRRSGRGVEHRHQCACLRQVGAQRDHGRTQLIALDGHRVGAGR